MSYSATIAAWTLCALVHSANADAASPHVSDFLVSPTASWNAGQQASGVLLERRDAGEAFGPVTSLCGEIDPWLVHLATNQDFVGSTIVRETDSLVESVVGIATSGETPDPAPVDRDDVPPTLSKPDPSTMTASPSSSASVTFSLVANTSPGVNADLDLMVLPLHPEDRVFVTDPPLEDILHVPRAS